MHGLWDVTLFYCIFMPLNSFKLGLCSSWIVKFHDFFHDKIWKFYDNTFNIGPECHFCLAIFLFSTTLTFLKISMTSPGLENIHSFKFHDFFLVKHNHMNIVKGLLFLPSNVCSSLPVWMSNIFTIPSMAPLAIYLPSGLYVEKRQKTNKQKNQYQARICTYYGI